MLVMFKCNFLRCNSTDSNDVWCRKNLVSESNNCSHPLYSTTSGNGGGLFFFSFFTTNSRASIIGSRVVFCIMLIISKERDGAHTRMMNLSSLIMSFSGRKKNSKLGWKSYVITTDIRGPRYFIFTNRSFPVTSCP